MDFTRQSTSHWLLYICSLLLQELRGTSYGLYVHRHKRMIVDFMRQSSHWLLYICSLLLQEWGLEGYQLWLVCSQTQEDDSGLYETINQSLVTVYMFSITTGIEGYQLWLVCSQTQEDDSGLYETINQSLVTVYMFTITTGMGSRGVPAMASMFTDSRG